MQRYKVVSESASGHCCFEASVVDTLRPFVGGGHEIHWEHHAHCVCECFSDEDAQRIADLLNSVAVIPDVEELAKIIVTDKGRDWGKLPETGELKELNEYSPGRTVDTPGRDHWRRIARQALAGP